MKDKKLQKNKGFTLLFAVLVSVLVLAVGTSIISIALRQVVLSGVGRDSQYAFYAANTGIECALFWDLNGGVTFQSSLNNPGLGPIPRCANSDNIEITFEDLGENTHTSDFTLEFNNISDVDISVPYCVDVTVTKNEETGPGGLDRIATTIMSRGYNTCVPDNPRRIERGLELSY
jgi:hypothetical protein